MTINMNDMPPNLSEKQKMIALRMQRKQQFSRKVNISNMEPSLTASMIQPSTQKLSAKKDPPVAAAANTNMQQRQKLYKQNTSMMLQQSRKARMGKPNIAIELDQI